LDEVEGLIFDISFKSGEFFYFPRKAGFKSVILAVADYDFQIGLLFK